MTSLPPDRAIQKQETGIAGFDVMTDGGLPEGRLTAIVGSPGAGKSIFALQCLLNRANAAGEPGLFVTFEESVDRIRCNVAALDWRLDPLDQNIVALVDARLPSDAIHAGAFDFSALLAILSARRAEMGIRNVVFDGIDMLMVNLDDDYLERQEVVRLDEWVRAEGVTAVMTVKMFGASERDQRRIDLIQYVTDCVVHLESKLYETAFARSLRVAKYRGSGFIESPAPMVIGKSGIEVIPFQVSRKSYPVFSDRLSSGVARLDMILDGGFIRGSSILVTGAPGTAKTSLACCFSAAACSAGLKAVFVSFDESDVQIMANVKSIGVDLEAHVSSGRLVMASLRSRGHSPEECFLRILHLISVDAPDVLVVDPMSSFVDTPYPFAKALGEALVDLAKSKGITLMCSSLLGEVGGDIETSVSQVSTIADVWMHVSYMLQKGERNRALTIIKARGTGHSNQVRELLLTGRGLDVADVYVGEGGVLLGSSRLEKLEEEAREQKLAEIRHRKRQFESEKAVAGLKARLQAANQELEAALREAELEEAEETVRVESRKNMIAQRMLMRRKSDDLPNRARRAGHSAGEER